MNVNHNVSVIIPINNEVGVRCQQPLDTEGVKKLESIFERFEFVPLEEFFDDYGKSKK